VLGNDALKIHLANKLKQRGAPFLNVIRVPHSRCGGLKHQTPKFLLAVCQSFRPQIPAVAHQKVESEKARLTAMK